MFETTAIEKVFIRYFCKGFFLGIFIGFCFGCIICAIVY